MRPRILFACLVPLLLVPAAGCTKSNDGNGVASIDGSAAPGPTPSSSRLDQLIRWTQCMREHGISISDPVVDGDTVRPGHPDKAAAGDKLFPAEDACRQYRPAQEAGPVMDLKNELALAFARCMRERGVENFPDPEPGGTRVPPEVGSDPEFLDAREFCKARSDAEFASREPSPGSTRQ